MPALFPEPRCALTAPFHPCPAFITPLAQPLLHVRLETAIVAGRFAFCGAFPWVTPAGRYPAPCFRGARTFLRPQAAFRPLGPQCASRRRPSGQLAHPSKGASRAASRWRLKKMHGFAPVAFPPQAVVSISRARARYRPRLMVGALALPRLMTSRGLGPQPLRIDSALPFSRRAEFQANEPNDGRRYSRARPNRARHLRRFSDNRRS